MSKESTQHKLDRTRKPRVHITYDVEKGDAMEVKELPFVVGVMSDLSGSGERTGTLKERKFHEVDRDSFNEFLATQKPRFTGQVDDEISGSTDKQIGVEIEFRSMKDFEPEGIVEQVPVLKELLEIRQRLKSLQSRVSSSSEVQELIEDILVKEERRREIASELAMETIDAPTSSKKAQAEDDAAAGTDDEPTKEGN